jgi:HEAT repeat protein
LESAAVSDPLLLAALWIGGGALALSPVLVAAILLLRLRLIARLAHEGAFAATWQPLLAACVEGVPAQLPPLAADDGALFLKLWIHAQELLRGEAQAHLAQFATRTGADRLAVRMLASGDLRKELLALTALGHLQLHSVLPLARALLDARSAVASLASAQALLRIDAAGELAGVVEVAARRADWPAARISAMLGACDPELAGRVLRAVIDAQLGLPAPGPALERLLRLAPVAGAESLRPAILGVLEHEVPPGAAAAALAALWHPEDARLARRATSHAQWFVRVAAAKALGRIGTAADHGLLRGMLSDPSWWVRYRSAQALARLPGMGVAELERVRASVADRYAADMLAQVIAEQGAA